MAVLAILVGAWMWWRCRRSSREESHKLEEGEHWLELPASDALSGNSGGKAFLPGAAAALGGCVLAGTFLAKVKPLWIMNEVTNNKKSLDISVAWPAKIRALLVSCFKRNPDKRPTMERIESDFPETLEQEAAGDGGAFPPGMPFSL